MNNFKQIFKVLALAIVAVTLATSCGGGKVKTTISQLEKCLGNNKTNADLNNLSKDQAVEIAKCMLGPMEDFKKEIDNMSPQDQEKFSKEFADAIEKSEYKEILIDLDYDQIKELANQTEDSDISSGDDTTNTATGESVSECDQFIKDYDAFADSYIKMLKKYKNNPSDASILTEYTEVSQKAIEMQTEAANCTDAKYAAKLTQIAAKLAKAAEELQ